MTAINTFDLRVLFFIYNNLHSYVLDKLMVVVTSLGNWGAIWILISMILMYFPKYRKAGVLAICAVLVSTALGEGFLKHLIGRPRPFIDVPAVNILIQRPLSYSFPSGHTATAFAAAGVLSRLLDRNRICFLVLAFLIAFSRMYLFVHYPTDIIGGIILGLISSKAVLSVSKNAGAILRKLKK